MNHLESYNKKMNRIVSLVKGCVTSSLNGVVIAGSPGIGKSHTIESTLEEFGGAINVIVVKGRITPFSVFQVLAENCGENDVVVFDDADSCFQETAALNLLKAATDTKKVRRISWISSANKGDQSFEFRGKVIIITNVLLHRNPHYRAMLDRMIAYDPDITLDERIAKIEDLSLQDNDEFSVETRAATIGFIKKNADRLSDISLRTYVKIAQLCQSLPTKIWEDIAEATILDDAE